MTARTLPSGTAVSAVEHEARRFGISLPPGAAERIARAVLECADDEHRVTAIFMPDFRDTVLSGGYQRSLRHRLAIEVAYLGMLPTALPRQVVVDGRMPWEAGRVELVVPVRRPLEAGQ